jgi:hypothetical protein
MPKDMLVEFPDQIQGDSEETRQLLIDIFAVAKQTVEGHSVEKEPTPPPVDALEGPTQNAGNFAKSVGGLGEKTTRHTEDVAAPAPVTVKQVGAGAEEDASLEEARPARSDGEEFKDLTEQSERSNSHTKT